MDEDVKEPFYGPHLAEYAIRWEELDGTVNDYTGLYELRTDESGQVCAWSLPRLGTSGKRLNQSQGRVFLSKGNVKKSYALHQLWGWCVIGPPPADGQQYSIDHIDMNHCNNNPYNLRWATPSQQAKNRKKHERKMKWVPATDDEMLLEKRQFLHGWFLETGVQLKQKKDGTWYKAVERVPENTGYYMCTLGDVSCLIQRIMAHIFGGDDGIYLKDINDESIIIEHLDNDKTNNNRNNLRVSTRKNNVESWHASGKSTKKRVYAKSMDDPNDLRVFDSAAEAARKIPKACKSGISLACSGKYAYCGNFFWSFKPFN